MCLSPFVALAHDNREHNFRLCESFLASGEGTVLDKFLHQAERYNPALGVLRPRDLTDLYLLLKKEEWTYAAIPVDARPSLKPLPLNLKTHLAQTFAGTHELNEGDDAQMTRFYVNGLRYIYARVGDAIRAERVQSRFAAPLTFEEKVVFESVLARLWRPKRLQDPDLSPEKAQDLLASREWIGFSWEEARFVWAAWSATGLTFSRRLFEEWFQKQNFANVGEEAIDTLMTSIENVSYSRAPLCCVSTPGCHSCPMNRRTLKRR